MRHHDFGRQRVRRRQGQASGRFRAQEVLHRHRLTDAQQRAVEHRVGAQFIRRAARGGNVEAPGFNAAAPAAEDEGQVGALPLSLSLSFHWPIGGSGGDEEAVTGQALLFVAIFKAALDARDAVGVCRAIPQWLAVAVVHRHARAGHRPCAVQRGHPHQAGTAAALEVHAQVGDQGAGARIHRRPAGQQRVAEDARLHLHHVVTALRQRDADDFGGAGFGGLQLRQVGTAGVGLGGQQRLVAGLVLVVVVALEAHKPAQQRFVAEAAVQPFDGDLAARAGTLQIGLHMAQRHRQHTGFVG